MTRLGRVVDEVVGRVYRYASWSLTEYGLTRVPPVRWTTNVLHRYFEARSTGRTYEVNGCRMVLPRSDVALGIRGFSERFVTDYFRRTVRPGMRVVDVGAHVGYYTLLFSRLVGESGQVFAFEPEPTNLSFLRDNLRANGCVNVLVVPKAVAERTATVELSLAMGNSGGHTIVRDGHSGYDTDQRIRIAAVALDDYLPSLGVKTVDVVKMDIEGGEYHALAGMSRLLRDSRHVRLVMEFSLEILSRSGIAPEASLRVMTALGFEIHDIGRSIKRVSEEMVLRKYGPRSRRGAMLLFSRPA